MGFQNLFYVRRFEQNSLYSTFLTYFAVKVLKINCLQTLATPAERNEQLHSSGIGTFTVLDFETISSSDLIQ